MLGLKLALADRVGVGVNLNQDFKMEVPDK